jgi:hypothetical protein
VSRSRTRHNAPRRLLAGPHPSDPAPSFRERFIVRLTSSDDGGRNRGIVERFVIDVSDLPGRRSPDGNQGAVSGDLLSYRRAGPELALLAYSPLLAGGYVRPDKPLGVGFDHPGTATRLAALRAVAEEAGATVNQVVLAWVIGGEVPAIPLVGASSVAQPNESWPRSTSSSRPTNARGWTRRDDRGALQPRRRGLVQP